MRIVLKSLTYFDNFKTFFLHFLVLPLFQAFLMALIIQDYTEGLSKTVMTASIILSSAVMALSMISGLFVGNVQRGIDKLVAVDHPYSLYYWGNQIIVCFLGAYLLAIINGILLSFLNLVDLNQVLLLSPICVISGLIMGLCASFLSWQYRNLYFWSNFLGSASVILGGTVGAVSHYPPIFKALSYLLPFGGILEVLYHGTMNWVLTLMTIVIWIILTYCVYRYQIKKIRAKHRY